MKMLINNVLISLFVSFQGNDLRVLRRNLFVTIGSNRLNSSSSSSSSFSSSSSLNPDSPSALEYLDLSGNGIRFMEPGVFAGLPSLTTLILQRNQIGLQMDPLLWQSIALVWNGKLDMSRVRVLTNYPPFLAFKTDTVELCNSENPLIRRSSVI